MKAMELRDWIAMHVLSGTATIYWNDPVDEHERARRDESIERIARDAYRYADAMMRVREEKQEKPL